MSTIFYKKFFCTKVFFEAFLYSQFGFVIFPGKNISATLLVKMLVKLTKGLRVDGELGRELFCICKAQTSNLVFSNKCTLSKVDLFQIEQLSVPKYLSNILTNIIFNYATF